MLKLDAQKLTLDLMLEYGLIHRGWTFGWIKSEQAIGKCFPRRQLIVMSEPYATHNPEAEVRDTILHEIAHALVAVDGVRERHHGPAWQAKAVLVGATPERAATNIAMPQMRWAMICPKCNATWNRHRKPRKTYLCGKCHVELTYVNRR